MIWADQDDHPGGMQYEGIRLNGFNTVNPGSKNEKVTVVVTMDSATYHSELDRIRQLSMFS
jgi:hypothetical protein